MNRQVVCILSLFVLAATIHGQTAVELRVPVEAQPLAANITRALQALQFLGAPLPEETVKQLETAAQAHDADLLQDVLDPHVLLVVTINPESRVKVQRGPAEARLQQAGFTPVLVKIINQSTLTREVRVVSPQSGQVYAGMTQLSAERMQRTHLQETLDKSAAPGRFLELEMYSRPPMTPNLSGLAAEYAIALLYSSESGTREATIGFEVGQGNQELGFRGEAPVLFDIQPAVQVRLRVKDHDGKPTAARFIFRDEAGQVFPPQAKRLAPDFYFQPQIYRRDGDVVLLPPGRFAMQYDRGPEYRQLRRDVTIPSRPSTEVEVKLERWINPMDYGFYSGDHHIHGAGCAHYTSPTEGVTPEDMFLQVKGEGLNVGCVLTWGPCFDYQRRFFTPTVHQLSGPRSVMKYDLEISGFGSEALGHVCLLNLQEQIYPGSDGSKSKGWPTWTTPVMRWARAQGASIVHLWVTETNKHARLLYERCGFTLTAERLVKLQAPMERQRRYEARKAEEKKQEEAEEGEPAFAEILDEALERRLRFGRDDFGRFAAGQLRIAAGRYPTDPAIRDLVGELRTGSDEFRELWNLELVETAQHRIKSVQHPVVGPLELFCDVLTIPDRDQHLVLLTAEPASPSEQALRLLAVVGIQSMDVHRNEDLLEEPRTSRPN